MDELQWIKDIVPKEPKTIDTLVVGDVVYYTGTYDECHNTPYVITRTYSNGLGTPNMWFDLRMEDPDPFDMAYEIIWSVQWDEIRIR